jgi:MFS family permease
VGLGLSLVELGAIWGMFPLAVAVFCIPMGIAADRYGVRLIVGIGVLVAAAGGALRGTSTGFAPLLAWMFLFGMGYATIRLPDGRHVVPHELGQASSGLLWVYAGLAITFGGPCLTCFGRMAKHAVRSGCSQPDYRNPLDRRHSGSHGCTEPLRRRGRSLLFDTSRQP